MIRSSSAFPPRRTRAFTLVELLVTFSLMAAMAGLGGISYRIIARHTLRQQADTIQAILTDARATAMREGQPVRVAFSLPPPDGQEPQESGAIPRPPTPALASYIFTRPAGPAQIPVTTSAGGRHLPAAWLPGSLPELSAGLLGRWTALPALPHWQPLDSQLLLTGELITNFHEMEPEAFALENLLLPPDFHGQPGRRLLGKDCSWLSPYPEDYLSLPYPAYPRPVSAPVDRRELLPGTGEPLEKLLGDRPLLHFPESSRLPSHPIALPVLEFLPDGTLSATWTEEIRLRLASKALAAGHYELVIETRTGTIRLVD